MVVHRPDSVGEEEVHRPDPDPPCTTAAPLPQCSTLCAATLIPVISRSNLRLALLSHGMLPPLFKMGSPSDLEQLPPLPSRMALQARRACAPPSLLRVPVSTPLTLLATKAMPVYEQHTLVYGFSFSGELPSLHLIPVFLLVWTAYSLMCAPAIFMHELQNGK